MWSHHGMFSQKLIVSSWGSRNKNRKTEIRPLLIGTKLLSENHEVISFAEEFRCPTKLGFRVSLSNETRSAISDSKKNSFLRKNWLSHEPGGETQVFRWTSNTKHRTVFRETAQRNSNPDFVSEFRSYKKWPNSPFLSVPFVASMRVAVPHAGSIATRIWKTVYW